MSAINGPVLLLILAIIAFAFLALMNSLATGQETMDTDNSPACEICGDNITADEATETIDHIGYIACTQCADTTDQEDATP